MAWRAWLPERPPRLWQAAALGIALAGAATGVRLAMQAPLGDNLPFTIYFPALLVAAAFGGYAGGLTCLAAATAAVSTFVLPLELPMAWAYAVFWIAGGLTVAVAGALSDSVRQLRFSRRKLSEAQGHLQTLVSELAHRNRNALAVIMSIVTQSARGTQSAAEAERAINARLQALLRAQEVILATDGAFASLRALVERAVEPFDLTRFEIASSPDVQVDSDVAAGLGLLFHELATNAVKHGALTAAQGRIFIGWTVGPEGARLRWKEAGGPPVSEAPDRTGFGSRLLKAALVSQGGKAERRFEPDGLVCDLHIPTNSPGKATLPPRDPPGVRMTDMVLSEAVSLGSRPPAA